MWQGPSHQVSYWIVQIYQSLPSILGVGESLPTLDSSSLSQQTTPDSTKLVPEADQDDVFTFVTPRRPSRGIHPANFYNGLDSAAGAKLLMSPAIVGRARRQGCGSLSYDDTSPVKVNPSLFKSSLRHDY